MLIAKEVQRLILVLVVLLNLTGCTTNNTTIINQQPLPQDIVSSLPHEIGPTVIVDFIDVGQGDSTLIVDNNTAILIDCGKNQYGSVVTQEIRKYNIQRLDYLIFSHMDADHIGGCIDVMENVPIDIIITNQDTKDTTTIQNVLDRITYQTRLNATEGAVYKLSNSEFTVIQALPNTEDSNAQSIVGLYTFDSRSVLFTGDCDNACETKLIEKAPKADILKVPHHGSRYATTMPLLDVLGAKYAVISVGQNSYGHPTNDVLDRLESKAITTYRTDQEGNIIFKINKDLTEVS